MVYVFLNSSESKRAKKSKEFKKAKKRVIRGQRHALVNVPEKGLKKLMGKRKGYRVKHSNGKYYRAFAEPKRVNLAKTSGPPPKHDIAALKKLEEELETKWAELSVELEEKLGVDYSLDDTDKTIDEFLRPLVQTENTPPGITALHRKFERAYAQWEEVSETLQSIDPRWGRDMRPRRLSFRG